MSVEIALPKDLSLALDDWYAQMATRGEMELISEKLPSWLMEVGDQLPDGKYMHYQMAAVGVRDDLRSIRARERIAREERRVKECNER